MASVDPIEPGRRIEVAIIVAGAVWLLAVAVGFVRLFDYGVTAGAAVEPPARWPETARIERHEGHPILLLFCHPHCPCTSATIAELARLLPRCGTAPTVTALFYADASQPEGWERSSLWHDAAVIPGVRPMADPNGTVAQSFAVQTSGTALLYAVDDTLVFHGGITASRGHEGGNAGADAIVSFARTGRAGRDSTPVFGCELFTVPKEAQ